MATTPGSSEQSSSRKPSTADLAREKASEIGSDVKEEATHQAETAQRKTSESVRAFADAIRKAGDDLAGKDQGPAARILGEAAGALENLSTALGQKRLEDMIGDVRRFGRERPGTFMAGSVLLGVALGRFARSGAPEHDRPASGAEAAGMAGPPGPSTPASPAYPAAPVSSDTKAAAAGEAGARRSNRQTQGGKDES